MKKIMFNDKYGLETAVLNGLKTMTRRDEIDCNTRFYLNEYEGSRLEIVNNRICVYSNDGYLLANKPTRYKVGEIVAIAQSYKDLGDDPDSLDRDPKDLGIRGFMKHSAGWNNKMFVSAAACKKHIRITGVKCERLQDISREDCLKEGIKKLIHKDADGEWGRYYRYLRVAKHNCPHVKYKEYDTAKDAFMNLIDEVSGKSTWERNPFVIAYEFKLID